MLALRRAKKAADEAAMAEAMLRRPPGDDTPVVEPDALRPVELRYGVAWLLEAPDEEEERCARRQRRRSSWAFERHGAFGARRANFRKCGPFTCASRANFRTSHAMQPCSALNTQSTALKAY